MQRAAAMAAKEKAVQLEIAGAKQDLENAVQLRAELLGNEQVQDLDAETAEIVSDLDEEIDGFKAMLVNLGHKIALETRTLNSWTKTVADHDGSVIRPELEPKPEPEPEPEPEMEPEMEPGLDPELAAQNIRAPPALPVSALSASLMLAHQTTAQPTRVVQSSLPEQRATPLLLAPALSTALSVQFPAPPRTPMIRYVQIDATLTKTSNGYGLDIFAEKEGEPVRVAAVDVGSEAEALGVREGDELVSLNGLDVSEHKGPSGPTVVCDVIERLESKDPDGQAPIVWCFRRPEVPPMETKLSGTKPSDIAQWLGDATPAAPGNTHRPFAELPVPALEWDTTHVVNLTLGAEGEGYGLDIDDYPPQEYVHAQDPQDFVHTQVTRYSFQLGQTNCANLKPCRCERGTVCLAGRGDWR